MRDALITPIATWSIVGLAIVGVILRPLAIPEAVWAVAGALLLVCCGLLPWSAAVSGVDKGLDVYLFLTGMMLLAEVARQRGLFDWLAARAARMAHGSARRLFGLVYLVGVVVTVFLSNDATAVVLTPAVAAVARTARVREPLPYLLACAFIANAASFVLPISNPANLVIYADRLPPLLEWLPRFGLASVLSIGITFVVLRWTQGHALMQSLATHIDVPRLAPAGIAAGAGIAGTAMLLMTASARGLALGWPTAIAGAITLTIVSAIARTSPIPVLREVSWSVLALVAGLFVLVEALDLSGVTRAIGHLLQTAATASEHVTAAGAGLTAGIVCNLVNNLPAGLIAGEAIHSAPVPHSVASAVLIGIDLGPNFSVTGSLATILWLTALRRDGIEVSAWDFLKVGLLVTPPALAAALAAVLR